MSNQHSSLSQERTALRERASLRLVTEKEEGTHVTKLPAGVYGFTNSPASEELPIFRGPSFRCFEIQKTAAGEVAIVGYASEQEERQLAGTETFALNLYPDPFGDAKRLISIPFARIDRRKPPSREDGNWMRIDVGSGSSR